MKKMKKRIRKKKHLKEFREWGAMIVIKRNTDEGFDSFIDDFLEQAIEGNNCFFGGGGQKDRMEGVIELGRGSDMAESRLSAVKQWLDEQEDIEEYISSTKIDLWYGPFTGMEEPERKI